MPEIPFISGNAIGAIVGVLREVDARPMRAAAETPFVIAFLSQDVPLAQHLVDLLYHGLRQHDVPPVRVCGAFPLGIPDQLHHVNVAVIVTREEYSNNAELALLRNLEATGVSVLVCLIVDPAQPPALRQQWLPARLVALNGTDGNRRLSDDAQATRQIVSAIRSLKAVDELSLARHLPAFRESISRSMVDDTALANAVYSFGSGILEVVPIANIPLNVADFMVLTKNQALMAYKMALAMGLTADFGQIMPQLAAVVGGGFLLRQTARGLIGLIPGFGLIPKVAVAFAGTYATGEVIYRWCAFGERVKGTALKSLYDGAVARGRVIARTLLNRQQTAKTSPEL